MQDEPNADDHDEGEVDPPGLGKQRLTHAGNAGEERPFPRLRPLQQDLWPAEHLAEGEGRHPKGEDIDSDTDHYLVCAEANRQEGHQGGEDHTGQHGDADTSHETPGQVGTEKAEEGAAQHEAFETDI